MDTLTFVSGSAALIIEYEVTELLASTYDVDTQIQKLEYATKIFINDKKQASFRPLLQSILQKLGNFSILNRDIRTDMKDIFYSYSPVTTKIHKTRNRDKRFLTNVYVWIIDLFNLNEGDEPSYSEHTSAAEQTLIHVKRQEFYQKHNEAMLDILVPAHATQVSLLQLLFQTNTLDTIIVNFSTFLNKIRNMMNSLLQDRVTHDLISTTDFYAMLLHIAQQAENKGLTFYHPLEKQNLAYFYQIAEAKAEFVSDTLLRVAILIPMIQQNTTYQLIAITKIPTFINNTANTISHNFIGTHFIHNDEFYVVFDDQQINACKLQTPRLCPLPRALFHKTIPSCELALFTNNEPMINLQCEITIRFSSPPFFNKISQPANEWTFSVSKPMEFIPQCISSDLQNQKTIILEGSGMIKLPPGCTFKSAHVHLHTHDIIMHNITTHPNIYFTPIFFSSDLTNKIEQQISALTDHLHIQLQNLSSTYGMPESIDLKSLIDLINEERRMAASKRYNRPWHQRLTDAAIGALETIAYSLSICAAALLFLRFSLWGCIMCIKARRQSPPRAI